MNASQSHFNPSYKATYPVCTSCYFKGCVKAQAQSENFKRIVHSRKISSLIVKRTGSPCTVCEKATTATCELYFFINSKKDKTTLSYEANIIEVLDLL